MASLQRRSLVKTSARYVKLEQQLAWPWLLAGSGDSGRAERLHRLRFGGSVARFDDARSR